MAAPVLAPQVNMHEAKTNLSRIARDIEEGTYEFCVVARHGKPILKISAYEEPQPKKRLGVAKGKFTCPDDDFFYNDDITELFKEYL